MSATTATSIDEITFTKAYLHLLNVKVPEPVLGVNYVGEQYWSVLPLPPMPQAKNKTSINSSVSESSIKVILKSIRNPRFTLEFDDIPSSDTVLSVKERLIGDPDGPLADGGYSTSNIRLLIKGKVISDSKTIGEVAGSDENADSIVSFVAMVAAPDIASKTQVQDEELGPEPVALSALTNSAWIEIKSILDKNLSSEQADQTLEKFKSSLNSL